ncbi:solute carrier family 25 member 35-like [Anastrepha obliqua]|uniref:solute carrier family 25 member 35-like n=1 Tax=Anastrepha obliqua TaxID=95512 RepID=UPI002409F049|nr:solute carrier family 25 member 35-like [Anastrepha obliqua]XP_054740058.1 solute carrier family 25 member 35-like [Anastrepha obliqua]XP_054740060.1 solute carrier family 25 member 35-like [Anastrepha obliqua]
MEASDFLIGGCAAMGAICFTNPLEVIKTRIQLQGELAARGTYCEPYKGIFHAFSTVIRCDGWLALKKGLVPALHYQFILNSVRLGIYKMAMNNKWMHDKNGDVSFFYGLLWGATGGVSGSFCASPFFMVKIQLQSRANDNIAVGHQHQHSGMINAFRNILKQQGFFGLWRGATGVLPRVAIGSSTQIATFGKTKEILRDYDIVTQSTFNSLCAAFIAGTVVAVAITPPDVVSTRLYNQEVDTYGKGVLYKGWLDCISKIFRTEGIRGLYKGFWANYLRQAPHSTLLLLFFDILITARDKYRTFTATTKRT